MKQRTSLSQWTPSEIDTAIAAIHDRHDRKLAELAGVHGRAKLLRRHIERMRQGVRYAGCTIETIEDELSALPQQAARIQAEASAIPAEAAPYNAEYSRRGGWTRAYLVISSGRGHIHRSTGCGTCRHTTVFDWRTELSGLDEAEIIALAGEGACTVCYPDAPLDVRRQERRILSAREVEQAARREELAQRRAAQAAKAITGADGSPLRDGLGLVLKTERATEIEVVRHLANHRLYGHRLDGEFVSRAVEALAAKRGVAPVEVRTFVQGKAYKRKQ
jgi:hypothetical protein